MNVFLEARGFRPNRPPTVRREGEDRLEYHHREDKVTWWEFYRLRDLTEEEDLLDERKVIAGMKLVKEVPGGTKSPHDLDVSAPMG